MRLCNITLALLIIAIIIIVLYIYFKYRHYKNILGNLGNSIETWFSAISYPSTMPVITNNYNFNMQKLGLSAVMSSINIHQRTDPLLPPYLKLVQTLPDDYGVVLKPSYNNNTTTAQNIDYIVAFRGTLSHEDILSDLKWVQVEYYGLGHVHQGFASIATNVYPSLYFPPNSNILITGHSLGASVAELIATRLAKEKHLKIYLYITARPRTGDLTWDTNVKRYVDRYIVINTADDIPQLPLPTMSKDKIGYGYISPPTDRTITFDFQTGIVGNNHNPLTYHYAMYGGQKPFVTMWYQPIKFVH